MTSDIPKQPPGGAGVMLWVSQGWIGGELVRGFVVCLVTWWNIQDFRTIAPMENMLINMEEMRRDRNLKFVTNTVYAHLQETDHIFPRP